MRNLIYVFQGSVSSEKEGCIHFMDATERNNKMTRRSLAIAAFSALVSIFSQNLWSKGSYPLLQVVFFVRPQCYLKSPWFSDYM